VVGDDQAWNNCDCESSAGLRVPSLACYSTLSESALQAAIPVAYACRRAHKKACKRDDD
jgi:hypothetical protein